MVLMETTHNPTTYRENFPTPSPPGRSGFFSEKEAFLSYNDRGMDHPVCVQLIHFLQAIKFVPRMIPHFRLQSAPGIRKTYADIVRTRCYSLVPRGIQACEKSKCPHSKPTRCWQCKGLTAPARPARSHRHSPYPVRKR